VSFNNFRISATYSTPFAALTDPTALTSIEFSGAFVQVQTYMRISAVDSEAISAVHPAVNPLFITFVQPNWTPTPAAVCAAEKTQKDCESKKCVWTNNVCTPSLIPRTWGAIAASGKPNIPTGPAPPPGAIQVTIVLFIPKTATCLRPQYSAPQADLRAPTGRYSDDCAAILGSVAADSATEGT